MKVIICIIVYNRYQNLSHWLDCWKVCDQSSAELIIIHNDNGESEKFKLLCNSHSVRYIRRENIGMDIGAFQDVIKERLGGFPNDWSHLLWVTDDTWPMQKDFIQPFIKTLENPQVGVASMQNSISKPGGIRHVRTTGFCLKKEIANRLQFKVDPIKTKSDCYFVEHRGGPMTMTNQIRAMGLDCVQVAPNNLSPLFDTGYWKRLDRQAEHDAIFPSEKKSGDKVTFICTIYNTYPQIISSLLLQTHKNWQLILIHDGQAPDSVKSVIDNDERIKFIETPTRLGNWGHAHRQAALQEYELNDYVVISNADNYYVPTFIEYMLKGFKKSHTTVAVYCDKIVHSYKAWDILPCRFERGFIDCGGVMVKSDVAKEVGWRVTDEHSADWIYFSDIASKYSPSNFVPVKGCLMVHN